MCTCCVKVFKVQKLRSNNSLVQVADDVFEDIIVFSGEPAQHVLHGEEPLLSITDLYRRQDRDENETHTHTKIETHPNTASRHINTGNDSGKQPEVKEKKREGRQTENSMTQCMRS